jgi:2-iminoacetate synthase ThiH
VPYSFIVYRYTLHCDGHTARRVERLATQYGLTEQEVLEQLVEVGLDELEKRNEASS